MPSTIPRRRLASFAADAIVHHTRPNIMNELAALLIEERREREATLLASEIEDNLAARGVVIATVISAHAITESLRREIARLIAHPTDSVKLREVVDKSVIGGVRIETASQELDETVTKKIHDLRAKRA